MFSSPAWEQKEERKAGGRERKSEIEAGRERNREGEGGRERKKQFRPPIVEKV